MDTVVAQNKTQTDFYEGQKLLCVKNYYYYNSICFTAGDVYEIDDWDWEGNCTFLEDDDGEPHDLDANEVQFYFVIYEPEKIQKLY